MKRSCESDLELRRTVAAKDQVRVLSNKERLRKCDTSLLSNDPNVRYRLMRGRITVDAREKD
ncbi:MAG TPA: hypothetical protein VFT02_11695 [Pyrinomonadaceae bacterium]|nr:hypothetical protein [Pyrinomonadaceae bacterium]